MNTVLNIAELKDYPSSESNVVYVSGYYVENDGGAGIYSWNANSDAPENGGTIIASTLVDPGRWFLQHQGSVDFKNFGVMDDEEPADFALVAMVNDFYIKNIIATNPLKFTERHIFRRSGLTLDFNHNTVKTTGIEPAAPNDPFSAVMFFQGNVTDHSVQVTLTEKIIDGVDVFQVDDSNQFSVGEWYTLEVNTLPGGTYNRELQKLVEIISIIDATHIRVNYRNAWELAAGRVISWTKVEPVQHLTIKNMQFFGAGDTAITGSHPLAFEYAIYANVANIHATGTFWPAIIRRWGTHYITDQCSLTNPYGITLGGSGYLTQQLNCLYGHVRDCHTVNARHLNDFTSAAYCMVENCHAEGDDQGPFVTHGQYEHDLVYTGNSGMMTFANSGAPWGSSAKRITVRKHVCPYFAAFTKITDLTLEDVTVLRPSAGTFLGEFRVNADGLNMKGCSTNGALRIYQASQLSKRKNIIQNSSFQWDERVTPITAVNVTGAITFVDSQFININGQSFDGPGSVDFIRCSFAGDVLKALPEIAAVRLRIAECDFTGSGLSLKNLNQKNVLLTNSTLTQGGLNFTNFNAAIGRASFIFTNNVLNDTTLTAVPIAANNVKWDNNVFFDVVTA